MLSIISISGNWQFLTIAGTSLLIGFLIVVAAPSIPRLYGHSGIRSSIQAIHSRPTPRVGGIAIFGAIAYSIVNALQDFPGGYSYVIGAATLLFAAGLIEDLGFGVSPARRLLAAAASSVIVVLLLGVWLPRLGIPGADHLATYAEIGVPLTLIITAGVTNGFNLIDGVNGLAGMTAIGASLAFGAISSSAGHPELAELNWILVAAVCGFFILNFPFGLVFLGDAGAYTLGFLLAWFGIAILVEIPDASPWAVLLCVFWPIADMLLAIFRRMRRKAAISLPDRLHVHQLVMRSLELCFIGRSRRKIANPLTTVVLAPFVLTPPAVGVLMWNDNTSAFLAVILFSAAFVLSYNIAPRLARRWRRRHSLGVVAETLPDA